MMNQQKNALPILLLLVSNALYAQLDSTAQLRAIAEHREVYKQEFLTDTRSPLTAADTAHLIFFRPSLDWVIPARFEPTPDAQPFDLPTYSGVTRRYRQYGTLFFEKNGRSYSLQIYQNLKLVEQEAYKDYLFLPFKDLTNGETTYGGGRYLDFRLGDIGPDNILILDFNRCYNPWCAYSDGYSCPIPPPANHLDLAVEAGELQFSGKKKH